MGKKGRKKAASHAQGRAGSSQAQASTLAEVQKQASALLAGTGDVQPLLDALRGPQGRQIVAEDQARENHIMVSAVTADLPELAMLRLQLGGDLCESLRLPMLFSASPVHAAVWALAPNCAEAFVQAGGDPNVSCNGWTPLQLLASPSATLPADTAHLRRKRAGGASAKEQEQQAVLRIASCIRGAGADIAAPGPIQQCPIAFAIQCKLYERAAVLLRVFSAADTPSQRAQGMDFEAYLRACVAAEAKDCESSWPIDEDAPLPKLLRALHASWRPGGGLPLSAPLPPFRCASPLAGSHQPLVVVGALDLALQVGAAQTLAWLLASAGAEAVRRACDAAEGELHVPIVHAVLQFEQLPLTRALHWAGSDLAAVDCYGWTVLHNAVKEGKQDCVAYFCQHVEAAPLARMLACHEPEFGLTAVGCAASLAMGDTTLDILRDVLGACRRLKLDISALLGRSTATSKMLLPVLLCVTEHQQPRALELLLQHGLDLRSPACIENVKFTPGAVPCAFLREPGAGSESVTVLMLAATWGNVAAVRLLLKAGADPRQAMPANRYIATAVDAVVANFRLAEDILERRPAAALAAWAKPRLDSWRTAVTGRGVIESDLHATIQQLAQLSGEGLQTLRAWIDAWLSDRVDLRCTCLLLLLWHGASLAQQQLGDMLLVLDAWNVRGGSAGATALNNFLLKRLKQCAQCGLLGRWRRCTCKRAWYCGHACQRQHWKAGHRRKCPLAQQLRQRRQQV